MEPKQLASFVLLIIELGVSVVMMIFYCRRVYKLSILASNLVQKCQFSMIFKISLIIFYICFEIIDIILAYTEPNYWLYSNRWMSFINLFPSMNMAMQIFIITREYKKKSPPILWHNLYLTFLMLVNILFIWIIFSHDQTPVDAVLPFIQIGILGTLVGFSMIIQRKRFTSVSQIFDKQILLVDSTREEQNLSTDKIYLQFNKQINLQVTKNGIKYSFQIAVYIGNHAHIITKTDQDFENLQSDMKKLYPHSNDVKINFSENQFSNTKNWLRIGEEKGIIFENYLLKLSQSFYFYTEVLLDFLEINEKFKKSLRQMNKRRPSIVSEGTIQNVQLTQTKKFFDVRYAHNKIFIDNPQILSLNLDRNVKQIQELHDRLLTSKKLKTLIITQKTDEEILTFIDTIANSKQYWNQFSAWMDIPQTMRVHIYNLFDMWYQGFSHTKVDVLGHEISMDQSGKTPTFYLFSLTKSKSLGITKRTIKKRFSEFVVLNKEIQKYYKHNSGVKIPHLPPKLSPFGNRTSPKSRQIYLQTYLVEVLQLPQIQNCIKVLQFMIAPENETKTLFRSNSINNSEKTTIDELKQMHQKTPEIQDLCVSRII